MTAAGVATLAFRRRVVQLLDELVPALPLAVVIVSGLT